MRTLLHGRLLQGLRFGVIAVVMGCSLACQAKSTGVGEDSAVQSGPCYEALVDRNAAQPTTAPNRELGAACETEHGDVEKAWARVIRLWGSDGVAVPDYDNYRRADAPLTSSFPKWFALAGMVLVYAVFGTPMRSAARLTGGGDGTASGAAVEMVASLLFRGVIGLALIWLLGLPYITALGGILLAALILWSLNAPQVRVARSQPDDGQEPPSGFSIVVAEVINDVAGGAVGLLGLALLAQHDLVLLAVALALAIAASAPFMLLARRRLRSNPPILIALSALLAAFVGAFTLNDPPIAAAINGATLPGLLVPLALAAAAAALGWRSWSASWKNNGAF
jgi:hypothetical protein